MVPFTVQMPSLTSQETARLGRQAMGTQASLLVAASCEFIIISQS